MPRRASQPSRRETGRFLWLALALLVCIAGAILEESRVHTDDGCAVEIHCVACRWACSAVGVSPEIAVPTTTFVPLAEVAPATLVQRIDPPRAVPSSRGPPSL